MNVEVIRIIGWSVLFLPLLILLVFAISELRATLKYDKEKRMRKEKRRRKAAAAAMNVF